MTTLLLVRHGETDWNAEGKLQGHTDRPLNPYGRRQAQALADRLATESIDALYASDLSRARETPEILGEKLGLAVAVDPDLREKNWGNWEGLTSDERLHIAYEGETSEDHRERTLRAVERIAERHPGE
jgi:broad specificity phosphatase PhoE